MKISLNGIIIREIDVGENDKIFKIFTSQGIISAIARGAKKIKKSSMPTIQLLAYCNFTFVEGKDLYIISEVEIIELFWNVRKDLTSLALAQYFCELCTAWRPDESSAPDLLRLLLNTMFFVSKGTKDTKILKSVFELRGSSLCGYMPNLIGCSRCKIYEGACMNFFIKRGVIVCDECVLNDETAQAIKLPSAVLGALRHIVYAPLEKVFAFNISENLKHMLCDICEKYIYLHVETNFKSLKFYKSIL